MLQFGLSPHDMSVFIMVPPDQTKRDRYAQIETPRCTLPKDAETNAWKYMIFYTCIASGSNMQEASVWLLMLWKTKKYGGCRYFLKLFWHGGRSPYDVCNTILDKISNICLPINVISSHTFLKHLFHRETKAWGTSYYNSTDYPVYAGRPGGYPEAFFWNKKK